MCQLPACALNPPLKPFHPIPLTAKGTDMQRGSLRVWHRLRLLCFFPYSITSSALFPHRCTSRIKYCPLAGTLAALAGSAPVPITACLQEPGGQRRVQTHSYSFHSSLRIQRQKDTIAIPR